MKNTFQTLTAVALFLGATLNSIAQTWNTGGNEIIGSEWFGADPNSDIPVRFEHRADEDESRFEWYTHDGVDVDERMRLTREGELGIGTTSPEDLFHVHSAGNFVAARLTKDITPLGLRMGIYDNTFTNTFGIGFIGMLDGDSQFRLFAHGQEAARFTQEPYTAVNPINEGPVNRLLLRYNSQSGVNLQTPYSMITMGRNWDAAEQMGLKRDWMNVGTTCLFNADILYTGLIEYENARTDAVTVWGCDADDEFGPDNYRFLFITGTAGEGDAAEEEGLETMRITPIGNVGVGDFSTMPNGLGSTYGQPRARLDVQLVNDRPDETANIAVNIRNIATESEEMSTKWGTYCYAENIEEVALFSVVGGHFEGIGGRSPIGVYGTASRDGLNPFATVRGVVGSTSEPIENSHNVGVHGLAINPQGSAWGIHGEASSLYSNHFAGYFSGNVHVTGSLTWMSDASLKQDVEEIEGALDVINQIEAAKYQFTSEAISQVHAPTGSQYGLLAQQVEEVLPDLVQSIKYPAQYNEEGEEIEA